MSPLADALAAIQREDAAFADLLLQMYATKYTGCTLLHWVEGVPRVVEFPSRQVRLSITRLDRDTD